VIWNISYCLYFLNILLLEASTIEQLYLTCLVNGVFISQDLVKRLILWEFEYIIRPANNRCVFSNGECSLSLGWWALRSVISVSMTEDFQAKPMCKDVGNQFWRRPISKYPSLSWSRRTWEIPGEAFALVPFAELSPLPRRLSALESNVPVGT